MICTECATNLPPVVVLDIDGTLGDYHRHFHAFLQIYNQRDYRSGYDGSVELHEWYGMDLTEYRQIKLAYRQGGMKRSMPVFDGAKRLTDLLRDEGVEIWLATTRPYMRLDNVDPDTRFWLAHNKIQYDFMIYGEDKYQQLLSRIQTDRIIGVLDDLPTNVLDAQRLGLPATLLHREHNRFAGIVPTADNLWVFMNSMKAALQDWRSDAA